MKQLKNFSWFMVLLLSSTTVVSQKTNEIPNADFEDWTGKAPSNYGAFQPPNKMFQTVFQSSKALSGKSCLRIVNATLMGQVMPGGVWYCKGDCSTPPKGKEGLKRSKFPITKRYMTLCGYYKASLKGGDKLWVSISVFKGETALGGSDMGEIQHAFITENTAGEWKRFNIPITYPNNDSLNEVIPDGAFLEIAIVNAAFPKNPYQMAGTAGSEVLVDKLTFCKGKEDILVFKEDSLNEISSAINRLAAPAIQPGYYISETKFEEPHLPLHSYSRLPMIMAFIDPRKRSRNCPENHTSERS